ncbi:hypothetical protein [Halorubrum salsamenti]|uniref:hypothetical protein n=1 Tax=Halorubrum salsamenti TaxID=2583990 RepID=UPI0011A2EF13|nr:hypothetical protein [Halorubrum salsamenti]
MTRIQQVLFELEAPYTGHPYFVSGNALFNAVAPHVDDETRRELRVSHGVFVPEEYGEYPAAHSMPGYAGKLGGSLPDVDAYEDLFLYRDAAQRWLLDSRPRDAHNTHDVQTHGGRVAYADTSWFGRPETMRNTRRAVSWYLHCYVSVDGVDDTIPLSEDVLDGIQVGAARNYGFGEVSVADTRVVEVAELDYSRLEAAKQDGEPCQVELLTPFVTASEYPGADDQDVPWWWGVTDAEVRRRETRVVDDGHVYVVNTIDHGQVVPYTSSDPVRTAMNGVLRVGTHSKYGFGEFRVRPAGEGRVPGRAETRGGEA